MIDFLKILSFDTNFNLRMFNNYRLKNYSINQNFKNKLNKEIQFKQATYIKEYKEILFCFFVKNDAISKLEVLIKPHYYFNNNTHNANCFSAIECINILKKIKDLFEFFDAELYVLNIEYGVNALSPIDVKDLITYALYHEKNEFINSSDSLKYSKISFKTNDSGRANNYKKIKFYAKGIQFPKYVDRNIFRFEVKSKRTNFIKNKLQIYSYDDLLKTDTYFKMAESINEEVGKTLILDVDNNGNNLTPKELYRLNQYNNPIYWKKALELSKNTFNNNKKQYYKLLDKTGNNIQYSVEKIIISQLNFLLEDCADLTPINTLNIVPN